MHWLLGRSGSLQRHSPHQLHSPQLFLLVPDMRCDDAIVQVELNGRRRQALVRCGFEEMHS
jgi:hypothetical protein